MESKTNYTIVGLTVLLLIAGLIFAGLWLSIGFDKKKYNLYTVYMTEPVSGLSNESLVKFNGVKVGIVDSIELSELDPQQVKIRLKIEEGTPITTSTRATLITQGITGITYLGLSASSPSFIPLQKKPGEPYPVIPAKPSFFYQLEKDLRSLSLGFRRILNEENAKNIAKTLDELPKVMGELKAGIDNFNTMAKNMSAAGKHVSTTMQAGKTGIDKLSQQTIPPMIILLRRLDLIAANLEQVSALMRQNPSVIIRGTNPPQSGPGE